MPPLPTAAIIGAGSSGIAATKALHEHGIAVDCFEASDRVGGNWVFNNRNGMSAAYRDLYINTSRDRMEYSDFPMPKSYPDFPHHTHIAKYFDDYVDHFGLRGHIRFRTEVTAVELEGEGRSRVTLDDPAGRSTKRSSWPTAITGIRSSPSRPSRARKASPASRSTHTTTASPTSASSTRTYWCSASATRPPTSPSRPRGYRT